MQWNPQMEVAEDVSFTSSLSQPFFSQLLFEDFEWKPGGAPISWFDGKTRVPTPNLRKTSATVIAFFWKSNPGPH